MNRALAAILITLAITPTAASATPAHLTKWYELNEECRGSIHPDSKETADICSQRDDLSKTLKAMKCRPKADVDGWTCP